MNSSFIVFVISLFVFSCTTGPYKKFINLKDGQSINFYIVSDIGRNGYFKQKDVAEQMGIMSESIEPLFIISTGNLFHANGIRSTGDPLWLSNYENIYSHPGLHCDWYPVLGNQEYRGNIQAILDYAKISRRWNITSKYYTLVKKVTDSISLRLIFIDTPSLIKEYRNDSINYPDVFKQDMQKQLTWIDSVLSSSNEKWKMVFGHHPIYSINKEPSSTPYLIEKLNPILIKYKVDAYISGHIHNFQHLRVPGSDIDYIITSSGSLGRPCFSSDSTLFTSHDEGFTICSVSQHNMVFRMVNFTGETIYQYTRQRN